MGMQERPRLPLLPSGQAVDLELLQSSSAAESNSYMCLGGVLWRAAPVMCDWLRCDALCGKAVLAIGDGTGACGLYAAGLGASRVVISDGDAACVALIARNVDRNRPVLPLSGTTVQRLLWGCESSELPEGPWDLVLGSDLVWGSCPEEHESLSHTLAALLSALHKPRVILAIEHGLPQAVASPALAQHAPIFNDETLEQFRSAAARHGLRLRIAPPHEGSTVLPYALAGNGLRLVRAAIE